MAIDLSSVQVGKDNPIKLDNLKIIKSAVKEEVARRIWYDDISVYSSSTYDYTPSELSSERILSAHLQKIIRPMQAINPHAIGFDDQYKDNQYIELKSDDLIKNLQTLIDFLINCQKQPQGKSNQNISASDCMTNCSGLCVTSCGDKCSSCTGCSGGCKYSCDGCDSSCTQECANGCQGNCGNGCGSCGSQCSSGCGSSCSDGCGNQCSPTGCGGRCMNNCGGCDGSCGTGCGTGCYSSGCGGICAHTCSIGCSDVCTTGCGGKCLGCSNGCKSVCGNTGTAI